MLGRLLSRLWSRPSQPDTGKQLDQAYASMRAGDAAAAALAFEAVMQSSAPTPALLNDLGLCHAQLGRHGQAEQAFLQALALDEQCTPARVNLGNLCLRINDPERAAAAYRRALEDVPEDALVWNHLALSLCSAGRAGEAMQCSRRALQLAPDDETVRANLIFALVLAPEAGTPELFEETRRWAALRAEGLTAQAPAHDNPPDPERTLRVGYVSADLREHPVASFVEPLLAWHDAKEFEITCYASHARDDAQTERLRALAHHWRSVADLSDEQLAARIREDRIDLLIDLSGHTYGNRLLTFAHRPAPLQFTYLGFPASTGMTAMDYRLTDANLDPPGDGDACYSEKNLRLPQSLWCFRPLGEFADPAPTPALRRGHVTFGSFNGFHKIHPSLLETWARLLAGIPGSRLLMITVPEGQTRQRIIDIFAAAGVDRKRITLLPRLAQHEFRKLHEECDLALDAFPCGGGATTCEVLWMGVPLVTCTAHTPVSRAGASLLTTLGLGDLIARDREQFIAIATRLAADPEHIDSLRQGMRQRMRESALMREEAFTRSLETLYRDTWREWCEKRR